MMLISHKKLETLYSENPCFFTRRIRSFKTFQVESFTRSLLYLEWGLLETCYVTNPNYTAMF